MLFKNQKIIISNGQTPLMRKIRRDILEILDFTLKSVDPYSIVKSKFDGNLIKIGNNIIDTSDFNNIYLVGFGKASAPMAHAVCNSIKIKKGAIITNEKNKKISNECVNIYFGSHPIPSQENILHTEKILDIIKLCDTNDLLIILISGGGSSLLCKPRVKLKNLQDLTDLLLKSGADINEINTIRKHLSYVKGGQLVNFIKCFTVSLIISDIINDPIESIASGPTYPDTTSYNDTKIILKKYDLWQELPSEVTNIIKMGLQGKIIDTPNKNNPMFKNITNFIIANNKMACNAAKIRAMELGYKTKIISTCLKGEARDIGLYLINTVKKNLKEFGKHLYISGGETTVTIKGNGKGGRNQEMVLSVVKNIANKDIVFTSFATDGIDGISISAGAIADKYSLIRANNLDLDTIEFLSENNSYEFFRELNDILVTGPTGTNVMDIQIIVC
jgi:hydroxypyruvate reductase/glycerate 2-kinase